MVAKSDIVSIKPKGPKTIGNQGEHLDRLSFGKSFPFFKSSTRRRRIKKFEANASFELCQIPKGNSNWTFKKYMRSRICVHIADITGIRMMMQNMCKKVRGRQKIP